MVKLPQIKPKELLLRLKRLGFVEIRTRGSHVILSHPDGRRTLVAHHGKPLAKGTLKAILRQTKLQIGDIV